MYIHISPVNQRHIRLRSDCYVVNTSLFLACSYFQRIYERFWQKRVRLVGRFSRRHNTSGITWPWKVSNWTVNKATLLLPGMWELIFEFILHYKWKQITYNLNWEQYILFEVDRALNWRPQLKQKTVVICNAHIPLQN